MSEPYLAEIKMFGGNFAPRGYATCSGQILSIAQNTALFSLLGTTYGGNGQTTFALPDLRGRSPINWGTGPGLNPVDLGQVGGVESTTLTILNMPMHNHTCVNTAQVNVFGSVGDSRTPTDNLLAADNSGDLMYKTGGQPDQKLQANSIAVTSTIGISGGSQPFAIRNPYLAVTFIIATVGIFPSRN